jgi:hypothetical protein
LNTNNLKKVIVGALLSGGIALAGLTAGTAHASNTPVDPSINTVPTSECTSCGTLPGRPTVHPNGGNKGGTQDSTLPGRPTTHPNGGNQGDPNNKPPS